MDIKVKGLCDLITRYRQKRHRFFTWLPVIIPILLFLSCSGIKSDEYPHARISNEHVVMKLYLPDPENGYYRATRFDWSGVIYSLEFQGHQYFGEWKTSHDPYVHEDITGPVESFGSPGLGYSESEPGGEFIRIGVGILEKTEEKDYVWNKTYTILDHGTWTVDKGRDWIEFSHKVKNEAGWGYTYIKRIDLTNEAPGFSIIHTLENTGRKTIETNQFNHNFFVIDNEITGPDFQVKFPFNITTEAALRGIANIEANTLLFSRKLTEGSIWMALKGYGEETADHQFEVINTRTGAGVRVKVDQPLQRLVFWATNTTLCPENFVYLKVEPGEEKTWTSNYTLFLK